MDGSTAPRVFGAREIRAAVPLDLAAVDAVEAAFRQVAAGAVTIPPIQQIRLPAVEGNVCIKSATADGGTFFVVKAASSFPGNAAMGLPNAGGMMVLFDARTGRPRAIMLDDGHLTSVRTGAAGAIAARHLARTDSRRLTIVGTGHQAEIQARAVCLVRGIAEITVCGRNEASGQALAARLAASTAAACRFEPDLPAACGRADIIVTTTPSRIPFLGERHVASGTHVTAMGSDASGKSEIETGLLDAATFYVCDSPAQCRAIGEYGAACARGDAPTAAILDLARLIVTGGPRRYDGDISIADLTGIGAQDLAIAELAYRRLSDPAHVAASPSPALAAMLNG